jgi:hypothetical protein
MRRCAIFWRSDTMIAVSPPHHNAVRSDTVSDTIRAVGQAFARLGGIYIHKDAYGHIDFLIYRQFRAYTKEDDPPL